MTNFSSWFIAIFAFMFWGLRLVGTTLSSIGSDFLFVPENMTMEIALLFVTFICICFIIKRRAWASLIYLVGHFLYYGPAFYTNVMLMAEGALEISMYMNVFFEFIGLVIPIAAMFDVLLDKNRKAHPTDKKTDWFYKNKQFDREMDERADRNNYRTM